MGETSAGTAPNPSWVSVPIPEEMLDRVQVFVLHLGLRGSPHAWDLDAMRAHLDGLDERVRHMVSLVALSALQGSPLSAPELAERLGVHVREVFGMMHLANDVQGVARPDLFWTVPPPEAASPVERVLMMTEGLAELVAALDRGDDQDPD